jgi:hypothetical protein
VTLRPPEIPRPPWRGDPPRPRDRRYPGPADPEITIPIPRLPADERSGERRGLLALVRHCLDTWPLTWRSLTAATVLAGLVIGGLCLLGVTRIDLGPLHITGGQAVPAPGQ